MSKFKVVIAEDVKVMRLLLKNALATYNCEIVAEFENGTDVSAGVFALRPDMIFLDINMPGKNGLDILQEIKSVSKTSFVAIVSAHSHFENIKRSMDLGADAFMVKPFNTVKVKEIIEKFKASRAVATGIKV